MKDAFDLADSDNGAKSRQTTSRKIIKLETKALAGLHKSDDYEDIFASKG
jgi:hypothetical protein